MCHAVVTDEEDTAMLSPRNAVSAQRRRMQTMAPPPPAGPQSEACLVKFGASASRVTISQGLPSRPPALIPDPGKPN